jgi:hypothetical protein
VPAGPVLPTGGARLEAQLRARLVACGDSPALSCVPDAAPIDGEPSGCELLNIGGTRVDADGTRRAAPDAIAWTGSSFGIVLDALSSRLPRHVPPISDDAGAVGPDIHGIAFFRASLELPARELLELPNVTRLARACFADARTSLTDAVAREEARRIEAAAKVAEESRAARAGAWIAAHVAVCESTWSTTGCDAKLDFLTDADRATCENQCTAAATEASEAAFEAAVRACGDEPLKAPATCSLTAPPGATVSAESQNAYCVAKCIEVRHARERQRQLEEREAAVAKAQDAAAQRQAAADAEANRGLMCRDGTESPSCLCHGPHRGCCSWHHGVAGCSALAP